ncbi:MAG TPA: Nif3-like dinuclear metal center hexameric protein [Spirochaetia bacterium]|nr:Nif3-like dinuclear metal center hexameric protein [Spirochaetia bacterium]
MTLRELDSYFQSMLAIRQMASADSSLNGIQVGRADLEVRKAAFAVDACLETFRRTVEVDAQVLFVHHGIYWGRVEPVTGINYERLKTLLLNDVALYAAHLPLDMHEEFGNNARMARKLGLVDVEPFGLYRGATIGCKGRLPAAGTMDSVVKTLFHDPSSLLGMLRFGPEVVSTVGIISGGAPHDVDQAIAEGLDLYITGESSHTVYHRCLEAGINVIFGGHYQTEVWGVQAVAEQLSRDTGLETTFIDIPTGL